MRVIYVGGKFSAGTPYQVEQNIRAAELTASQLMEKGFATVCPHSMGRFFQGFLCEEYFLEATMAMMEKCDAVFLVPGWEGSNGTRNEINVARMRSIPVFNDLNSILMWRNGSKWTELHSAKNLTF